LFGDIKIFNQYFYHEHIKRTVAVFGTLFNNIKVVKRDSTGKVISTIKVPLSYGPRQKVLARIADEKFLNDPKLAIRLPRMSFEIISLTYDTGTKLQKGITQTIPSSDPLKKQSILYPTTYRIGLQLNILAKNQDDALQILEQILPYFQPEYTVTVKEVENNFKSDVPFVLQAVTMTDDYEGDFMSRRSIIYTLEFEAKVRFYGPLSSKNVIKTSGVTLSNPGMTSAGLPYVSQTFTISPADAGPDDQYEIVGSYETIATPDSIKLFFDDLTGGTISVGDTVQGSTSLVSGRVSEVGIGYIIVAYPDGNYLGEETVTSTSDASFTIKNLEPIYRTISIGLFPA
jgi:hypothetical protein